MLVSKWGQNSFSRGAGRLPSQNFYEILKARIIGSERATIIVTEIGLALPQMLPQMVFGLII
jgi:hypothetical protein